MKILVAIPNDLLRGYFVDLLGELQRLDLTLPQTVASAKEILQNFPDFDLIVLGGFGDAGFRQLVDFITFAKVQAGFQGKILVFSANSNQLHELEDSRCIVVSTAIGMPDFSGLLQKHLFASA